MRVILLLLCLGLALAGDAGVSHRRWMNPSLSPKERAAALLNKMNTSEIFAMVYGVKGDYVGNIPANKRLSIPALNLQDGPQGVGDGVTEVTCWPSALTVCSTWDIALMTKYAAAMAGEQKTKGTNIMLGPMVNIARVPMDGRSFESFGEDPHLSSEMARSYVRGTQSQGIMACVKHWCDNNQELNRTLTSANVDERTQWEIYYPAFQAAVEEGVASVMCSYNRINNIYACENPSLTDDLKGRMGYEGFVMSDWGATHSTVASALAGLDMQMPDGQYFGAALQQAVSAGKVPMSRVNDMVLRILTSMFMVGLFDEPQPSGNLNVDARSVQHTQLAASLAAQANVLLKNDKATLPLDPATVTGGMVVYGIDAQTHPTYAGNGSGHVIAPYVVTPLEAIQSVLGSAVKYVPYDTSKTARATAMHEAGAAQVAVVFVSVDSSEGIDRTNLSLPGIQDQMVADVAQSQPNTIVVIHSPGAVLMPWIDSVPAVIAAWLPGQEDGNAIASVLFGNVNPSGRLPLTFPASQAEIPVSNVSQYPGINNEANYSNKLLVGYRWWDANNLKPLFPFGHGLSYSTFAYSDLAVSKENATYVSVSFVVTNTAGPAGMDVPQLYVGFPSEAGEPPKQLKAFDKLSLDPSESATVTFHLGPGDFSIWDISSHAWKVVPGTFTLYVGHSSGDISLQDTVVVG